MSHSNAREVMRPTVLGVGVREVPSDADDGQWRWPDLGELGFKVAAYGEATKGHQMVPGESRNTRQSSVASPAGCGHDGESSGGDEFSDAVAGLASGGARAQGKRKGCGGSQRAGRGLRGARGCRSREDRRRGSGVVRRRGSRQTVAMMRTSMWWPPGLGPAA